MVNPTHLVFLRHGRTEWNHAHRLQGQADVHLDETGVQEAHRAAGALASRKCAAVYSSDLRRALDTASTVAADLDLDVVVDPRLQEINVGTWSGLTRAQVEEQFPDYADFYHRGIDFRRSETGETIEEMVARAMPAVEEIIARHEGNDVLVVAHGFLIQKLLQRLLGIDGEARILGGLANAHWSELGIADNPPWLVSHNVGAY